MGWPRPFLDLLRTGPRTAISLALRVSRNASGGGTGAPWLIASDQRLNPDMMLLPRTLQLSPSSVSLQSWAYGCGALSVEAILPDVAMAGRGTSGGYPGAVLRRGALVELLITTSGGGLISDYEPLRLGVISSVRSTSKQTIRIEMWDIIQALRSRPFPELDADDLPQTRLFHGLAGTETTVAQPYIAYIGALVVTSLDGFETVNGTGLAVVSGDGGGTFYVTYTGTAAGPTRLTGVSTVDLYDTVQDSAAAFNTVRSAVLLEGHPLTIAERLLVSTGVTGANSAYDVNPAAAGFALDYTWIDDGTFRDARTIMTPASGVHEWSMLIEDPIEDGYLWLQARLAQAGAWLCQRQGQIAAFAIEAPNARQIGYAFEIQDRDIIGQPEVEWYNTETPDAYNRVTIATLAGESNNDRPVTVLPARDEIVYDLSDVVITNDTAVQNSMFDRLGRYCTSLSEVVTLTIAGVWGLAPGEWGTLTTERVRGRLSSTYSGYTDRRVLLISVTENPLSAMSSLKLVVMPEGDSDDYA